MMPPIKVFFSLFSNMKPILEQLQNHSGKIQTFGEPEIRQIDVNGKPRWVVIEKTAFESEKDARIFVDIANRVHTIQL